MPSIFVSNGTFAFVDSDIYKKYRQDKFFENHDEPRHLDSGRTLAQIVLDMEKGTKKPYYFKDGNKFNCERSNLTFEHTNIVLSSRGRHCPTLSKGSHLTEHKGVEYRKKATKICTEEAAGWYAVYQSVGRECIAGPFSTSSLAAEAYNNCTNSEVNKVKKFTPRGGRQPESVIQEDVVKFLQLRGWLVHVTHMNQMESGWPDLNAVHPKYGVRFIDIKVPFKGSLTKRQKEYWPIMHSFGAAPYIMTAATDYEYKKLFGKPNYSDYLVVIGEGGTTLQGQKQNRPKNFFRQSKEKKI